MADKEEWLDFKAIKNDADVIAVLRKLGILDRFAQRGDELVGFCPLGSKDHGKKDSFNFSTSKRSFQCFACKERGSVLDFVTKLQDCALRDAALFIRDIDDNNSDSIDEHVMAAVEAADRGQDANTVEDMMAALSERPEELKMVGVMSLGECLRRIKGKFIEARDIRCVDVSELRLLNNVMEAHGQQEPAEPPSEMIAFKDREVGIRYAAIRKRLATLPRKEWPLDLTQDETPRAYVDRVETFFEQHEIS